MAWWVGRRRSGKNQPASQPALPCPVCLGGRRTGHSVVEQWTGTVAGSGPDCLACAEAVCLVSLYSAEMGHLSAGGGGCLGYDLKCGLQLCISWVTWLFAVDQIFPWASESCVPVARALDGDWSRVWILVSPLP